MLGIVTFWECYNYGMYAYAAYNSYNHARTAYRWTSPAIRYTGRLLKGDPALTSHQFCDAQLENDWQWIECNPNTSSNPEDYTAQSLLSKELTHEELEGWIVIR